MHDELDAFLAYASVPARPVYSVVSGDTLLSIAAMAKTTVKAILANNPDVWDAPSLMPQTQLCLPLCSAPAIH